MVQTFFFLLFSPLDEEARPQRRNRSRRRRNRGSRPDGGSASRDRQPTESGELLIVLFTLRLLHWTIYSSSV